MVRIFQSPSTAIAAPVATRSPVGLGSHGHPLTATTIKTITTKTIG